MPMWKTLAAPINSTIGPMTGIGAGTILPRLIIWPPTWSDTRTSTITATGATIRIMAMSGTRTSKRAGLRITPDTGIGSLPGDIPGSTILLGAMLRSTMDAGWKSADGGDGSEGRSRYERFTRPRWWSSSAAVRAALAATWDGSRWGRAKFMFRPP